MANDNVKKLRLYEDYWNPEGYTNENMLANALLTKPDLLSPVLTHLVGREDKRFPLSFLTEGVGNTRYVNDIEYDYPVMGAIDKAVEAVAVDGNGYGGSVIRITFKEKKFNPQYIIFSPDGIQLRLSKSSAIEANGGWQYEAHLASGDPNAFITSDQIVGKMFSQGFAPVAPYGSTGTESNWVAPSKMRNQITHIRKSYRYEGNVQNKVVNIQLNIGGKVTTLWSDFEEWQHQLKWREEVESMYWYSQYNRDANGVVNLKDENGNPIPIGSGILEQIPNFDTYASLTAKKIKATVRDVLYGATDAQAVNIVLYTGLGGLEEFDNAMKEEVANGSYIKNVNPVFVTGTGRSLSLTGFFTSYEHIDGHKITVRHLPLLDNGVRALNSYKHPITGLPLESYRMIFLDQSVYDGEANVLYVSQKGREMVRWAVAGATIPKGFQGNDLRATDVDGSSVHFLKVGGMQIRRATNCMHLECSMQ